MRLRTDIWWSAGLQRSYRLGALDYIPDPEIEVPAAEIGDVWIARRDPGDPRMTTYGENHPEWPITGYGLTCPLTTCRFGVHVWDHASDCPMHHGTPPCKMGRDSCWEWSGSIEAGDLTANPSLHCPAERGGCGFHGFLRAGVLS